jgi:hypothetical protein
MLWSDWATRVASDERAEKPRHRAVVAERGDVGQLGGVENETHDRAQHECDEVAVTFEQDPPRSRRVDCRGEFAPI